MDLVRAVFPNTYLQMIADVVDGDDPNEVVEQHVAGRPTRATLRWRPDSEREQIDIFRRAGLKTDVREIPVESFRFIQGALESDDRRHARLVDAVLGDVALPVCLATEDQKGHLWMLDGHHRLLATVQTLWPPYPPMRTIVVQYKEGRPFFWTDGEFGHRLKHSIPTYR